MPWPTGSLLATSSLIFLSLPSKLILYRKSLKDKLSLIKNRDQIGKKKKKDTLNYNHGTDLNTEILPGIMKQYDILNEMI